MNVFWPANILLAATIAALPSMVERDNGFKRNELGAPMRWPADDLPLLVIVHPSAEGWLHAFQSAADEINYEVGCVLVQVDDKTDAVALAFMDRSPGVVPVLGFELSSCGADKESLDCRPRTYPRSTAAGTLVAAPMFMPAADWRPRFLPRMWEVAMHELGHALGLEHDDQSPHDYGMHNWSVMEPAIDLDGDLPGFTHRDRERLRAAYCEKR